MKNWKQYFAMMTLIVLTLQFSASRISSAATNVQAGDILINEVAWAGSPDNSNDEWIELYNATGGTIDLSGWYIEDDYGATTYSIESGEIAPYGYFLIEDNDDAVSNLAANAVINLSLANSGDSLVLKSSSGSIIDSVNTAGGSWYGGNSDTKATMEKIDPKVMGDIGDNWATSVSGNGGVASDGTEILGTPGGMNSVYAGSGPEVQFSPANGNAMPGESVSFSVEVNEVNDLFAYGFDIIYDPDVLNFVSASESDFLKADGEETSFFAGLENDEEGKLVIANARLANPAEGIDGEGELFAVEFEVVGEENAGSDLIFAASSFLADSAYDMPVKLVNGDFAVGDASIGGGDGGVDGPMNLQVEQGDERYGLDLTWDAGNAEKYIVSRQNFDGTYVVLGETSEAVFVDNDSVTGGGNIIPFVTYNYEVVAVNGNSVSEAITASGMESRGITGDNNRSDRVDGRDLEQLARSYAAASGDENYVPLKDTTFDGIVDGNDLIDLGVNFGLTYSE